MYMNLFLRQWWNDEQLKSKSDVNLKNPEFMSNTFVSMQQNKILKI